jgi:FkbM family methyltransferase
MLNLLKKLVQIGQRNNYLKPLLQYKVAAGIEHSQVLDHLNDRNFRSIVDIGANRGQFALVIRNCFPEARIHSFEPLKEPAAIFRRVFASDPKITLHEIAIGPENKEMLIHVSRADDSSSLLPIASLQSTLFPGTEEKEERTVRVRRLDTVLSQADIGQPAFLKIDVQGFEKEVLEGCEALLPCFSHVYVECSFVELYARQALAHEVILFLEGFGFALCGIYNLYYDKAGVAIQGDFLFENKNPII